MNKPTSPSTPRPNDEPFYIPKECPTCNTKLVLLDTVEHPELPRDKRWNDEFICPQCDDGLSIDEPTKREIAVDGCITTDRHPDRWIDDFIEWIESRGESFGGGINDVIHQDE